MMPPGNLKRLNPREVWWKETGEFTPWLAEHSSDLGKEPEWSFKLQAREVAVGDFAAFCRYKGSSRKETCNPYLH